MASISARIPGPVSAGAIAGLAVLANPQPPAPQDASVVLKLIVEDECGRCPWHDGFAKSLARSYVKQSLGQG